MSSDDLTARLLMAASVQLARPLLVAQDPDSRLPFGHVVDRLIGMTSFELTSDMTPASTWKTLLHQLGEAADEYEPARDDGEDFVAMAAGQLGTTLELAAASDFDLARCQSVLRSTYEFLEDLRLEAGREPYLTDWLTAAWEQLERDCSSEDPVATVRNTADGLVAIVTPHVLQAYEAWAVGDDW